MTETPLTIDQILNEAVVLHRSDRWPEAEQLYRLILERCPDHAGSLHHLGLIARRYGDPTRARALISRALVLEPELAEAYNNLGNVFKDQGRPLQAVSAYGRAIKLDSNFFDVLNNLAATHSAQKRPDEAFALLRGAAVMRPDQAEIYNALGIVLRTLARLPESMAAYGRAITVSPDSAEASNNLGNLYGECRLPAAAFACYRRALSCKPDYVEAYYNLGNKYAEVGQPKEATVCQSKAIQIRPDYPEATVNLGLAQQALRQWNQAALCYQRVLCFRPEYLGAYNNLGNLQRILGQANQAVVSLLRALALKPEDAETHSNIGIALSDQGQLPRAGASFRRALALKPDFDRARSNLLLSMNYADDVDLESYGAEHARAGALLERAISAQRNTYDNVPNADRRLRVGYVSPDFRTHSVAFFFEPLLREHDRSCFEIYLYGEVPTPDVVTARMQGLADGWLSTVGVSDESLANQIRADRIDILVDLAGHSAGNRLPVFAHKPAPIQVTWLGYGSTTGLTSIDYRLTDNWLTPEDGDERFTERLWRLPRCSMVFSAPDAPPVTTLPFDHNGFITFGSFNKLSKVTPATIALWSSVLRAVSGSRLVVKARQSGDSEVAKRMEQQFAILGVGPDRLIWRAYAVDIGSHLAEYGQIDIALDTFPYGGGTTTCEALWMGVPVVTLIGERLVSRLGFTYLAALGLEDLATLTPPAYAAAAAVLAADVDKLRVLRHTLRERMAISPLCDGREFARVVETAYRAMWREWCKEMSR